MVMMSCIEPAGKKIIMFMHYISEALFIIACQQNANEWMEFEFAQMMIARVSIICHLDM